MPSKSLLETAVGIIDRRGKDALEEATQRILERNYDESIVSEALKYYAHVTFPRVMPIFPALIHLSCEAVGGKPEDTKPVAAAMLLITATGDIHDDVIDQSTHKFGKKTVLGKFGRDTALLAGDALLVMGMEVLQIVLKSFDEGKRANINSLITKAMFELTAAEATETCLWRKKAVTSEEYFEVIRQKGCIAELHCRIGGILGGADQKALDNLTKFGRTIGILATTKDEFMDISKYSELKCRFKNEMLPYPVILAFGNAEIKRQVVRVISGKKFARKDIPFIAQAVLNSPEVNQLRRQLREMSDLELRNNPLLNSSEGEKEAAVLLEFLANEL